MNCHCARARKPARYIEFGDAVEIQLCDKGGVIDRRAVDGRFGTTSLYFTRMPVSRWWVLLRNKRGAAREVDLDEGLRRQELGSPTTLRVTWRIVP